MNIQSYVNNIHTEIVCITELLNCKTVKIKIYRTINKFPGAVVTYNHS